MMHFQVSAHKGASILDANSSKESTTERISCRVVDGKSDQTLLHWIMNKPQLITSASTIDYLYIDKHLLG